MEKLTGSWMKMMKNPMIDPIAEAKLDVALNDVGQQFVAQGVKRLESDEASLAWRSRLNESLLVEQTKVRRIRLRWAIARPVAGLAAACSLGLLFLSPKGIAPVPGVGSDVEANVMHAHSIAENNYRLTGFTLVSRESEGRVLPVGADYQWEEADLGAL